VRLTSIQVGTKSRWEYSPEPKWLREEPYAGVAELAEDLEDVIADIRKALSE